MIGVFGNTFLTERIFQAMDKENDKVINLDENLTYNGVIVNGTIREKREQNVMMLNENKYSVVTY